MSPWTAGPSIGTTAASSQMTEEGVRGPMSPGTSGPCVVTAERSARQESVAQGACQRASSKAISRGTLGDRIRTGRRGSATVGVKRNWSSARPGTCKKRRLDLPLIREGTKPTVRDGPKDDEETIADVLHDTHAATSRKSIRGRMVWWEAKAKHRGFDPYPLDAEKLQLAAGLLKMGRYRSAGQYLYTIKKAHVQRGHPWGPDMDMLLGELRRSCTRGLGGSKQAAPVPLCQERLHGSWDVSAWPRGWEAISVGCWWLLREIELANLTGADITFRDGAGCGSAMVTIRASKSDTQATGCTRTHDCICPATSCPVQAARGLAEARTAGEALLQNEEGNGLSKSATVCLLKSFAVAHGHDATRITGHSMRVTGAQLLATAGLSTEQIRIFGRWGSVASMAKYTREAHILPEAIAKALAARHGRQSTARAPAAKRWCKLRTDRSSSG